jgi:hypothetical protein
MSLFAMPNGKERKMATLFQERPKEVTDKDFDPEVVNRVAIKATSRLLTAWGVKDDAAARLAGVGSMRTWQRMKHDDWGGELSQDQLTRMSALVGLYQGLHVYFGNELADDWVALENEGPVFGGASPLDLMLEGGIPAIIRVRDYVDALRGGL